MDELIIKIPPNKNRKEAKARFLFDDLLKVPAKEKIKMPGQVMPEFEKG